MPQSCRDLVLKYGMWGEHPDHCKKDWAAEVSANETLLSYWGWVQSKLNSPRKEVIDETTDEILCQGRNA